MATINDPLVGTTFDGRYRIERRIGSGGMANVYLAEDETLGRRVAIKLLHQRYADDSQFVERFLREASAAARLNHPNIVQVYDRGQCDGAYYIAMEFVDGMTLKDLVRRRGALTEQEVLAYARQGLHALRFAHRNGIIHRDVKPHNMMVDTDGRLKIADFGIARAAADVDRGLTEAGSIVGTAQYLSPEQAQGLDVAAPSDLYSLGIVMFEMATGHVPFDGDAPVNVALKHVKDPAPRPSSSNPHISVHLESIILKALEKDPSYRYHSADDMLNDLDRARDGAQTTAMTQVMAAQTQQHHTAVAPVPNRRYETPVPPEPAWPDSEWDNEDQKSRSKWRIVVALLVVGALALAAGWFVLSNENTKGEPVPDVVGQSIQVAREDIKAAGFEVGRVTREASDEQEGLVLRQSPEGSDTAEKGTKIDLVVSSGPEPIEVPDVVGKSRAAAMRDLERAGFEVREGARQASDRNAGIVLSTSPAAGNELAPGATVTIIVSSGPEAQRVPSVIEMTESQARSTLEADPFKFVVQIEPVDGAAVSGVVLSQSPAANTQLAPGETVVIRVATGKNAVPDVIGNDLDTAETALRNAGFEVTSTTRQTSDPAQFGAVIETSPRAGSVRGVGTTVTITIGEATPSSNDDPANT